jgi:hypothetical protein
MKGLIQMTRADRVHSTPPTNTSALPVDPTRRHLLTIAAGGAVAAAIPAAALADASAIDPIFAAIDEHRKAQSAHFAAIAELSRLEKIHGDAADGSITEQPCHDDCATFDFLLETAATAVAGLFAKIDYLREIASREAWMLDEREGAAFALIESFAESFSTIWGVQA